MKLGDISLKHLQPGIRMFNADKTKQGTLKYTSRYGWCITWDDGKMSPFGEIDSEGVALYNLEIMTKNEKIVLGRGWFNNNETFFTH